MLRYFLFLILSLLSIYQSPAQYILLDKVDPVLVDRYKTKIVNEYIVLMKDRVVFNDPLKLASKSEKAFYVYKALLQKAVITQKPIISFLLKSDIPYQSFIITNALKVTSTSDIMKILANRDDVEQIIDNGAFRMLDYSVNNENTSLRNIEPEWNLKMIKADSVWLMGFKGGGVTIAGQDTGYDWQVSPLQSKYRGFKDSMNVNHNFNWHDAIHKNSPNYPDSLINSCGYNLKFPCDDSNHGTHTMGIMVGEDTNNKIGVAPDSKWIGCRNMDRGWGQPSTYLECFEWFLAPYDNDIKNANPAQAPHVINNSWYCSTEEGCNPSNFILMEYAVKNLKASGIVVVASAGNSGPECASVTGPPAFFGPTFSVGATSGSDIIASFSSRGPVNIDSSMRIKPNVSAPGVAIRSVIRNGAFASYNGTSMAGPHVAGLVALMISANPALAGKVELIENIIEATCVPKVSDQNCNNFSGSSIPNVVYGFGRIDALAAVKQALAIRSDTKEYLITKSLKITPNPATEFVQIAIDSANEGIHDIKIYDLSGKMILNKTLEFPLISMELNLASLREGIYFCQVSSGKNHYSAKIIKL
jgi:subtilisin family serine protease